MHGVIPIVKPRGMTSTFVCQLIKRHLKPHKHGHVGTLDPLADGVLPIVIGKATRLQEILLELPKTYDFTFDLGYETDTLDLGGTIIRKSELVPFDQEKIVHILKSFTGEISQEPPAFSALKLDGASLYKLARRQGSENIDTARFTRKVFIYNLTLRFFSSTQIALTVRCSKGTYVRSLARDIAKSLGMVATVSALTRTEAAGFKIEQCYNFDEFRQKLSYDERLELFVWPIEKLTFNITKYYIKNKADEKTLLDGKPLLIEEEKVQDETILLFDTQNKAFGLAKCVEPLKIKFIRNLA